MKTDEADSFTQYRLLWVGLAVVMGLCFASSGFAQTVGVTTYKYHGTFEDAVFDLETAIVDRGLVIDNISHVGEMLNRTRLDVGSEKVIFEKADVYQFCSAALSRKMMEADPLNIAYCPYGIFVFESGDGSHTVELGFRDYPDGPMEAVESLLNAIAKQVAGK